MRRVFIVLFSAVIVLDLVIHAQALLSGIPTPPASLFITTMMLVPLTFTLLN